MMVDVNSTHNYSWPYQFKDHPLESISLNISSLICVFTSVFYSFLIKKKLSGLNTTIKTILYFMAGGNFFCHLIVSVNISLMYFWQLQNFISCTMNRISQTANYFNIVISLALISQVRYYIAVKTSQIKAYKKKTLHYIIATVYILSLSGAIIVTIIGILYGKSPIVTECSGKAEVDNDKYRIALMILAPFALLIIIINLIGDISMLFFIWKRKNQVSPVQLIPWKSVSKSEDNDMAVPVHATSLSVVSLIVLLIIIAIATKLNISSLVSLLALNRLWINVVIPYVMLFKIIKTKKPKPIIPKGLQMHEEDDEAAIEYKDVNEEANKMVDSCINNHLKLGETNSRQNCPDFSNEVILDPRGLKFSGRNCIEESIELKPIVHEVPIMV